jgi:uncharacterized protein
MLDPASLMLDSTRLAWVLLAAFGSAILGGVGGFGTGIILTAVLIPLVGVKAVVPVLSLAGVLINGGRFWFYRREINWPVARRVLMTAVPALVLGTFIYARLDARPLGILIGCMILLSIPIRRTLKARAITLAERGLMVGGGVFGLTNGFASGMGVILVSLLLGAGLSGPAVLATDALITIFIDLLRAAIFGKFDLLNGSSALLGLAIGVATFPGSWLASVLVNKLHARLHILFMEALIVFGGIMIIWNSWSASQ